VLRLLRRFSPVVVFSALFTAVLASFRNRAALQVEVLALLSHQLGVLHRSVKRPKLTAKVFKKCSQMKCEPLEKINRQANEAKAFDTAKVQ
jgi:hypothetical protein